MLIDIGLETKIYVRKYQWLVPFGAVYCALGEAAMLNLVQSACNHHVRLFIYAYISTLLCQILLGCLLLIHTPSLYPNPGYAKAASEALYTAECEALSGEKRICPERHANLFSRICFGWMTPLMQQGYKKPIDEKDVWQLDTWDQTESLIKKFQGCWAEESKRPKPLLLRAMMNSFGKRLLFAWSWMIGFDLCQLLGPIILNHLLKSMQKGDPSWVGYVYAFSIFLGLLFGVICESQFYQNVMRVGLRLRSTLVAAIFRKSLRLTHGSRKNFPSGKITNLITTDATAFQEMCQQLHGLWSAPFRIILSMVLLYQQLGVASLVGTLILALMIHVQTFIISKLRKLKKERLQSTDNRVSLMNEVLSAMEIVKCYAWEKSFQSRIQNLRDDELSWFRSAQFLSAFNKFILNSIPAVVTMVTFGAFTFLGGDLTPARAFTSLSLFQVLEFLLYMLPLLLNQVVNTNVSVQRVEELFLTEQRILAPNPPLEPGFPAISIKNGHFSWDSKADTPTLSNINLDIPVGSLVAIVGGTGEGKTSLISAIIGELPPAADASVIIRGTVAYVPQISWIFNATVRDNILFGSEYEPTQYWKTIDATALQHDLDLFPGHDLTEIGERGVNISGGQRQRVSMARAVYSGSDVYIFDDPLSALDAHVGRQVFSSCIKKALHGKTRILVTNQLHFLRHVDRIILMCEGMIKEEGTFVDLSRYGKLFQKLMENAGKIEKIEEQKEDEDDIIQNKNLNIVADSMEESTKYAGTIGGVMIWITAAFAVMQNGATENQVAFASTIGLLLTYTLKVTNLMSDVLRQASKTEISLNSVERVGIYINLPSEAPDTNVTIPPPPAWPSSGSIKFRNVFLRYRPELPPVLHGISFNVSPCEKLGIVGRTGAGKSSLLNALFRIVEIERGEIIIDGFDITKFGLTDLRKGLSIIPQSPVLFSGTVRFNLDPFNQYNEADLWEALERAHLKEVILWNSSGLDAVVYEGGENFSVGQRQLLSLARALLKRSKILVLDEATAAIDVRTDALVQKTIREEFKSCTLLVIAHRLNTIINCNRILVLDAGQVVEHASPEELLSNEESAILQDGSKYRFRKCSVLA